MEKVPAGTSPNVRCRWTRGDSSRIGGRISMSEDGHTLTGDIRRHANFPSALLDNRREVLVYLPPGYSRSRLRYPVLYLHDGQNVFDAATSFTGTEWGVDETAQRLIESKEIASLIVVAVANAGEAEASTGERDPARVAQALRQAGTAAAVVTCGAEGCWWTDDTSSRHSPAALATVVDTTGAGDTFCGTLAAAMAAGRLQDPAIGRAGRAAAITISRRGAFAALPTVAEFG